MNTKAKPFLLLFIYILFPICLLSQSYSKSNLTFGVIDRGNIDSRIVEYMESSISEVLGGTYTIEFPSDKILSTDDNDILSALHQLEHDNGVNMIIVQDPLVCDYILKTKYAPKAPCILFGTLFLDPDEYGITGSQRSSGIRNVSILTLDNRITSDLNQFYDLFRFRHLGVLVDSSMAKLIDYQAPVDTFSQNKQLKSKLFIVGKSAPDLASFLTTVDAIYYSSLVSLDSISYQNMIDEVNSYDKPSFSARGFFDVNRGVLAGAFSARNVLSIFRRLALNVEAIASGIAPSTLPSRIDLDEQLIINMATARTIDWYPSWKAVVQAQLVGNYDEYLPHLSLTEALYLGIENNSNYAGQKKNIQLQRKDLESSVSTLLPDLSLNSTAVFVDNKTAESSFGTQPERSLKGAVQLEQLIYNHSATRNIAIQKKLLEAAQANLQADYLDLIEDISSAYFNVLRAHSGAMVRKENLDQTSRYLTLARTNKEIGIGNPGDVYRWESQYANAVQGLIDVGTQVKAAEYNLLTLLNLNLESEYKFDELNVGDSLVKMFYNDEFLDFLQNKNSTDEIAGFFVKYALDNEPGLEMIDQNLGALRITKNTSDIIRYIPTVAASAAYNRNFDKGGIGAQPMPNSSAPAKDNWNIGINASIPIFQGNALRIQHRRDKIAYNQLTDQKLWAEQQISQAVRTQLLKVVSSATNISLSKVSLHSAQKNLELVQESYSVGSLPIIDLLDAQNNYFEVRQAYTTAVYDYLDAVFSFERLIGRFTLLHTTADNQKFAQEIAQYVYMRQSEKNPINDE